MFRNKLFCICIFLLIAFITPVTAQPQETLAVLDFTTEAVSKTEMTAIVEFLSAELFNTKKYVVIDVSQRETILQEMEFSLQGCSDEACALEIGKLLSAELIVVGNLSKVGTRYLMSVKMLQTETSRTMGTANGKFNDLDELIDGLTQIAYTLAGEETAALAAALPAQAETASEPEPPEEEPAPLPEIAEEPEPAPADEPPVAEASPGEFNWLSFIVSSIGTVGIVESGIFGSIALNARLESLDIYDNYITASANPGEVYSGSGDEDYEHYYNSYSSMSTASYIAGVSGGTLAAAAGFLGDSYISFGGKLAASAGVLAFTAGNISALMAANNVIDSRRFYSDYMSAGSAELSSSLYSDYSAAYENYILQQNLGYGLWIAGGVLSVSSWIIPGEKSIAPPSLLERVISGVGYFCLAAGNFTYSMALNSRFDSEDAYNNYIIAENTEAAASLYSIYDEYQNSYQSMSYITYGLWGAGTAAIITALFIPEAPEPAIASDSDFELDIRPSLTGFGIEVEMKFK